MTQQALAGVREVSKDAAQLAVNWRAPANTDAQPSSLPQPYTLCALLHSAFLEILTCRQYQVVPGLSRAAACYNNRSLQHMQTYLASAKQ